MEKILLLFLFIISFLSHTHASEVSEQLKRNFYKNFVSKRIHKIDIKLKSYVEEYNRKNKGHPYVVDGQNYVLKLKSNKLVVNASMIALRQVEINGKVLRYKRAESIESLKRKIQPLYKKETVRLFNIFINFAHATDDSTFNRILLAVMNFSNYEQDWGFDVDDAKKVYDEIVSQHQACEEQRAKSGSKQVDVDPKVNEFINDVLYTSYHSEYEDFMKKVREEIVDEDNTASSSDTVEKKADELLNCQALSYLVGKEEFKQSGTLTQSVNYNLRDNLKGYLTPNRTQNIKANDVHTEMAGFCYRVEQLASCLAETYILPESVSEKYGRDIKTINSDIKFEDYQKKYNSKFK